MFLLFCILAIALVSMAWAYLSLKHERQRHEIDSAKKEIETGRVIFHSSSLDSESP
jgi:cell division protein FtsL